MQMQWQMYKAPASSDWQREQRQQRNAKAAGAARAGNDTQSLAAARPSSVIAREHDRRTAARSKRPASRSAPTRPPQNPRDRDHDRGSRLEDLQPVHAGALHRSALRCVAEVCMYVCMDGWRRVPTLEPSIVIVPPCAIRRRRPGAVREACRCWCMDARVYCMDGWTSLHSA